ncbi:MAG: hypothetical protein NVSMB19_13100 [Vulcanimicrobiaceae bacterium]
MGSRIAAAACSVLLVAARTHPAGAPGTRVSGTFALAGVPARSDATLRYTPVAPLAVRVDIVLRAHGRTVRAYDTEMTQRMHLIVLDETLSMFEHLHPQFAADGRFSIVVRVPRAGRYYVYADASPHRLAQQVFRFAVPIGAAGAGRARTATRAAAPIATVRSGAYTARIDARDLRAGTPSHIGIAIAKNGIPATDLRPYLGSAAHAVFIDTRTLAYLHVHPASASDGPMDGMAGMTTVPLAAGARVGSNLELHVPAPAAGTYKLWLQFRGGDGLHVAPFTIGVR